MRTVGVRSAINAYMASPSLRQNKNKSNRRREDFNMKQYDAMRDVSREPYVCVRNRPS